MFATGANNSSDHHDRNRSLFQCVHAGDYGNPGALYIVLAQNSEEFSSASRSVKPGLIASGIVSAVCYPA